MSLVKVVRNKVRKRRIEASLRSARQNAGTVKSRLNGKLIVSLTSYPKRFDTLHIVIRSILAQTLAPDHIRLYLDHGDEQKLPTAVRQLIGSRFSMESRPPIRAYGKLVNALADFPDAFIVTVDDDMVYDQRLLAQLVDGAVSYPGVIACARAHRLSINLDRILLPYGSWPFNVSDEYARRPSVDLMPTGVGGVLYPPGTLHPDASDMTTALEICPTQDDVWFYWMARLAGTRQVKVGEGLKLKTIGTQDTGLFHVNWHGANDRQIRAMWNHFGPPKGLEERVVLPPEVLA